MMTLIRNLSLFLALSTLSSCGIIYKPTISQGNILEQDQVDQLEPGMSKRQVSLILGTPAIADTFHANRWDYVNTLKVDDEDMTLKSLSLSFENDRLVKMEGDYFPSSADLKGSDADTENESASNL